MGSRGGVTRIDEGGRLQVREPAEFLPVFILPEPEESAWVAMFGGGLRHLTPDGGETLGTDQGLSNNRVLSLFRDAPGTLWIGTQGGGLCRLRDRDVICYTELDGLCGDTIFRIIEDDAGDLWMSSNAGVFRVRRDELDGLESGAIAQLSCNLYGRDDGIRAAECNGGTQPAGWKARDGRLWFPTPDGVVTVDPGRLVANAVVPPVHLLSVLAGNEPLALGVAGEAAVRAGTRTFEFRYTAPSLRAPEQVRFRYALEGFDADWVEAGDRRTAFYTNLAPGAYRFRVTASNDARVWNETGDSVRFRLAPRFYETSWFYAGCLLGAGLLGGAFQLLRVRAMKIREAELTVQVEERTRELREATRQLEDVNRSLEDRVAAGIDALREAERMAAYGSMVAGVAHEVRHPIFVLRSAAHVLARDLRGREGLESQLGLLERETSRMSRLMDDLLQFAKPSELLRVHADAETMLREAAEIFRQSPSSEGVQVEVEVERDLPKFHVDKDRLLQVLLNLMENASKHAAGMTTIRLRADREREGTTSLLRLDVENDGEGIPEEEQERIFEPFFKKGRGAGLGLAIARRIVSEHGGRIEVASSPRGPTRFSIRLPG